MIYEQLPVHSAEQLNAMSEQEYRSYETRVRRAAERQGLRLGKSRRRDPRAYDFGTYSLVYPDTGRSAARNKLGGFALKLDDVANALNGGTNRIGDDK